MQDEGKSKEGRSSEERGGEWENEPTGTYKSEHAVHHHKKAYLCPSFLLHLLPFSLICAIFRPSWNRQKVNSGVCQRSSRAWGTRWLRETPVSFSCKTPSPHSPRNSPPPTGKRSDISLIFRDDIIEKRLEINTQYGLIFNAAFWIWKGFKCVIYPHSCLINKESFTDFRRQLVLLIWVFIPPPLQGIHQSLLNNSIIKQASLQHPLIHGWFSSWMCLVQLCRHMIIFCWNWLKIFGFQIQWLASCSRPTLAANISFYFFLFFYGQAESEAAVKEMRSLRERLNSSERAAEGLKSDLSAMVAHRDQGQADLHQARLQAAQLTLQLADSSLALREGRARWAQERQTLLRTAEVLHCCKAQNLKWGI